MDRYLVIATRGGSRVATKSACDLDAAMQGMPEDASVTVWKLIDTPKKTAKAAPAPINAQEPVGAKEQFIGPKAPAKKSSSRKVKK